MKLSKSLNKCDLCNKEMLLAQVTTSIGIICVVCFFHVHEFKLRLTDFDRWFLNYLGISGE